MKNLLTILFLSVGLFLVGCSSDSSLVGPTGTELTKPLVQSNTNSFLQLLPLTSLNKDKGDKNKEKNNSNIAEADINGSKGGKVKIEGKLNNGVKYEAKLVIPKGAFEGVKKISIKFDGTSAVFDFGPSNTSFVIPLLFSAEIKGLDLGNTDPNDIHFGYISNGNLVQVEYDKMKVDVKKGKLEVKNAQIDHFSRYGWSK